MLLGLILMSLPARASCFDTLNTTISHECIGAAEVLEFQQGQTQVYVCETLELEPDVVAILTIDADFPISDELAPETCSGGFLYLSDRVDSEVLLRTWGDYMDSIFLSSL